MLEQRIYVDTDTNQTVAAIFTPEKLQNSIYAGQSINDYYIADGYKNWTWLNVSENDIPGELWRPCPNYPGCSASTFGRIRKNGKIVPQYEEHYKNYSPQQLILLLLAGATNVGWLCVDVGKRGGACYVYKLVADAWLIFDKDTGLHIHHISNNGYDNSPYNLIPLDETTHGNIDHKHSVNDIYHGPEHKIMTE